MAPKKEPKLAYILAIVLLALGVLSYSAFSAKTPENPIRIMFKSAAGNVLFDHKTHLAASGYGLACTDCHHHPEEEADLRACGDCHRHPEKEEKVPQSCLDCHELDEIEDTEMLKRADAFHMQCINCHKEIEAGPEECRSCHVM